MTQVVTVKLRHDIKPRWFEAGKLEPEVGDHIIVETDRGREMGIVYEDLREVTDEQLSELPSALKSAVRVATEADLEQADELAAKGDEAMLVFRELIAKHKLDMKPVSVEYLFGGDKAVFYFSAEERVDFREIVRDLASRFHIRIDMRQIGVRDEARFVGGISHCGEELCCTRFGGEFKPVSIRMAKEQDLPLNPTNISGLCGRLMCCLRYEFEAYKDFKSRAPKKGALIETPLGTAKVVDFNTPAETITMRLEDGKQMTVPLGEMSCGEGAEPREDGRPPRPCMVDREALEAHMNSAIAMALSSLDREDEGDLTDQTAEHHGGQHRSNSPRKHSGNGKGSGRGGQGQKQGSGNGKGEKDHEGGEHRSGNRRRRRGRSGNDKDSSQASDGGSRQQPQGKGSSDQRKQSGRGGRGKGGNGQNGAHRDNGASGNTEGKARPGQHSSGVRASQEHSSDGQDRRGSGSRQSRGGSAQNRPAQGGEGRRAPRRRHPASSDDGTKEGS